MGYINYLQRYSLTFLALFKQTLLLSERTPPLHSSGNSSGSEQPVSQAQDPIDFKLPGVEYTTRYARRRQIRPARSEEAQPIGGQVRLESFLNN